MTVTPIRQTMAPHTDQELVLGSNTSVDTNKLIINLQWGLLKYTALPWTGQAAR